jgi:hypothetical protein
VPPSNPLRRAAAWARANDGPLDYGITAPALDALAERVERGELACDLPASAGWSDAVEWAAERVGVDAWAGQIVPPPKTAMRQVNGPP